MLSKEIDSANAEVLSVIEGYSWVSYIYLELFDRTKTFTGTVEELVSATIKHAPLRWAEAARLCVDFSITVLRSKRLGFHRLLNSQRKSIYWMLDEALLRICLDKWEDSKSNAMWDRVIRPIKLALATAEKELPGWAELDRKEFVRFKGQDGIASAQPFMRGYFERTTVRLSGIGRLPNELANVIIEDVLDFEELPKGDLRPLYLSKGKGKG
ncbi:hypothetical protein CC86DRAFT_293841 [Ophiobolus disseminans]|uniref:Uncharacterized protein n=1 Tax=Ophiobolus disseminans TaxID=1469910 RepID=A0A6A6ZY47_9PLEO|nr:hypothetical protein CC86DRAFT_293841 [Ophiobolus disseminans]